MKEKVIKHLVCNNKKCQYEWEAIEDENGHRNFTTFYGGEGKTYILSDCPVCKESLLKLYYKE